MPTIGTEAMPTANAIEVSRNSSRAPMPNPASTSVPKFASMWVKMLTLSTDCSGEKQAIAPTFRMSDNIARWMRSPRSFGTTRARPENNTQPITAMLTENAISAPAATPRMPNDGMGPTPSASVPPITICSAADDSISADGSFMLPVPRRTPAMLFISQGMTAPPKKICV